MGIKVGYSSQRRWVQAAQIREPQVNRVISGVAESRYDLLLRQALKFKVGVIHELPLP